MGCITFLCLLKREHIYSVASHSTKCFNDIKMLRMTRSISISCTPCRTPPASRTDPFSGQTIRRRCTFEFNKQNKLPQRYYVVLLRTSADIVRARERTEVHILLFLLSLYLSLFIMASLKTEISTNEIKINKNEAKRTGRSLGREKNGKRENRQAIVSNP